MTKRHEFQPEEHPVLARYLQLIEAAEYAVKYRCGECGHPSKYQCNDCIFGPLKMTLDRIGEDKKRQAGDGRG
jgi:hypothetical protein